MNLFQIAGLTFCAAGLIWLTTRWTLAQIVMAFALIATLAFGVLGQASAETVPAGSFSITDGDTVRLGDERIRLLDIDTPESHQSRCERESRLADAATARLGQILTSGPVRIDRRDTDRYGRTLAYLYVNGREVGRQLVQEGFALPWKQGAEHKAWRLSQWCPR